MRVKAWSGLTPDERQARQDWMQAHPVCLAVMMGIGWGLGTAVLVALMSGQSFLRTAAVYGVGGLLSFGPAWVLLMRRSYKRQEQQRVSD